jgi:hypothetical protein
MALMRDKDKVLQELVRSAQGRTAPAATAIPGSEATRNGSVKSPAPTLTIIHEQKLLFKGQACDYYVLGMIPADFSKLEVTLSINERESDRRERFKLDMFEREECTYCAKELAKAFLAEEADFIKELIQITNLLEEYRDAQIEVQQARHRITKQPRAVVAESEKEAIKFLSKPGLIERLHKQLAEAGVMDTISLLLYTAGTSYKNDTPLHIAINGDRDSVRDIIYSVSRCLPDEDILLLNQVSNKSFYHCTNDELKNKVLLLPHGVDKKVAQALRLLQQGEPLITATSIKDKLGNIVSSHRQVQSHFSSIVYVSANDAPNSHVINTCIRSDNKRDIQYYNKKVAGLAGEQEEAEAKELLRNMVRCLKPLQVVNPNAGAITLSVNEDIKAHVNRAYQELVKQVCLLHQYQRTKDAQGRLVAEKEDMRVAAELLFGSIQLDTDELDALTRRFYEQVRTYISKKAGAKKEEYYFTMQELRKQLGYSGSGSFRFISRLYKLSYVEREGHANKGFRYRITCWEDADKFRKQVKDNIISQLELSGMPKEKTDPGMPRSKPPKALTAGVPETGKYTYALNERAQYYGSKTETNNNQ